MRYSALPFYWELPLAFAIWLFCGGLIFFYINRPDYAIDKAFRFVLLSMGSRDCFHWQRRSHGRIKRFVARRCNLSNGTRKGKSCNA